MSEYQPFEEYYQGWSLGTNVVLLRRDHNGKIVRDIQPLAWYFYAKAEQCAKLTDARIEAVVKRGLFNKVERGERHWKFYVDNPQLSVDPGRVFKRMDNPDLYDIWHRPFTTPEKTPAFRYPEYRDRWREIHEATYWLESQGIVPLEADLTPLRRFLIDNDVKIQENYRVAYFDLETDDRGKLSEKESQRILSVAWEGDRYDDDPDDCGFLLLEEMSDWGEKKMLSEFVRQMKRYDVLVAWNGNGFDFPMVIARARAVGVRVNWRLWHFADPLPVFRKRFLRQQVGSYALDSMGNQVLGERKLDWREEFRRRHPGVPQTMYELWLRDVDLLEEYNRRDVSILHRLEEATNFLSVERLQNRVAGIFANDFTVSNKIDTMILRKGQREDVHFRTRVWSPGTGEKYVGAHVFDPDVGLHSNVAVFDFKALYPSMIRSFNISPETYIRPEERERWLEESPELVCTCPLVTTEDGIERGGATYRIDSEGFVGQMFKDTTDRRNKYKKLAEERVAEVGTEDDDKYKLYDNLAYAFKSLGLSFYGEMGHASGRYYEVEMAESITLGGQYFIRETQRMASELGYRVIYGDTDSVFIQLMTDEESAGLTDDERRAELLTRGEKLRSHCQNQYEELLLACNSPKEWHCVQLEFEDAYDKIAFFAKKRYAGRQILSKGKPADGIKVKGLEYMRSDYTTLTRKLQYSVLEAVLKDSKDAVQIATELIEPALRMCESGKLPFEDIVISKAVTKDPSDYVTKPLHVRLAAELKRTTADFYPGIKIRYIVMKHKPTIDGCFEHDFDPEKHKYDVSYYWDNVIYPATLRVLQVLFPEKEWRDYLFSHKAKREKLLARYSKWLGDRKRRADAIKRIRENAGNVLTDLDIATLRDVLKDTEEDVKQQVERHKRREAKKAEKERKLKELV